FVHVSSGRHYPRLNAQKGRFLRFFRMRPYDRPHTPQPARPSPVYEVPKRMLALGKHSLLERLDQVANVLKLRVQVRAAVKPQRFTLAAHHDRERVSSSITRSAKA